MCGGDSYHRAMMSGARTPTANNRLGLDYRAEAERLGAPVVPIIDAHAHINGGEAARVYDEARRVYGVVHTFTQTLPRDAEAVREVLGESISFVAVADFLSSDRLRAHKEGMLEGIRWWHGMGARMVKFWSAPRGRDLGREVGEPLLMTLDAPWRREQMELAASLGVSFMVHIADPDTWFATKYSDASIYGSKRAQYEVLERLLEEYRSVGWLVAHMGGWPENLEFLSGLLERHENFVVDTSATKWMVRELSKHPRERLLGFLRRFRGRVLFGSDIVTMDAHLSEDPGPRGYGMQASSAEEAFELYASRYWAYRTMFETRYEGESAIADPDLAMVDPEGHDAMSAPALRGFALPEEELRVLYREACVGSLMEWYARG